MATFTSQIFAINKYDLQWRNVSLPERCSRHKKPAAQVSDTTGDAMKTAAGHTFQ
ncbi:hypothetical protein I5907_05255 [Panacibacter sp. DH6]|uniref:Uncharacterized protein n=1 Tax=Panacibacter microcysteis TaxID=2793269 RepID=A0A931E1A2_9BACT|nr:hypothetical protein [Panacibacter microcysteis]MBG9375630.1 hypothetical protein [Panacibacter microcysteis]